MLCFSTQLKELLLLQIGFTFIKKLPKVFSFSLLHKFVLIKTDMVNQSVSKILVEKIWSNFKLIKTLCCLFWIVMVQSKTHLLIFLACETLHSWLGSHILSFQSKIVQNKAISTVKSCTLCSLKGFLGTLKVA